MGWTGTPGKTYTKKDEREQVVYENLAKGSVEDIAASRRDTYVAAKSPKTGKVQALVFVFSNRKGEGMYKIMGEEEGPFYYNCPQRILNKLTEPAPNLVAAEWRQTCRSYNSKNSHYRAYRIVGRNPGRKSRIGIDVVNGFPYRARNLRAATGYETETEAQKVLDTVKDELQGRRVEAWVDYL